MARAVRRDRRVLGTLARERGAAVVHDNTSVVLGGGAVARRAGAAHAVHVREIWTGGGRAERAGWPLMRRRILGADRVLCISEAVRAQFGGSTTAQLLRDGLPRSPRPPGRAASRTALGLPADAFVVALVGRVHPWKGQDVLARALAEPALADIGAIGVVAGSEVPGSGQMRRLDELAAQLGVGERLVRLGFREDVDAVLGSADVVTVPSTRPEPLGLVALEAAAAGLPVVASAAGGVAEAVEDGRTGLLVAPGDHRELARALAWLAGGPPEAERWGAAAAERVEREFSVHAMVEQLQTTYDELANLREAP
jgi:glycosyltransferase involved in cell wall biosynthesis